MESIVSQLLVFGILVFLLLGSGVLFWDGLALSFGHARPGGTSGRLAGARLLLGFLGVALTLWLAAGYLTRVR